jgi:two-component system CheB/CheR fusion protein
MDVWKSQTICCDTKGEQIRTMAKKTTKSKQVKKASSDRPNTVKKKTAKKVIASKPVAKTASAKSNAFSIVGIGASAGGLEPIEKLFSKIPADCNIAFVVIQHLPPEHKSVMGSLLEKYTSLKILEIQDDLEIHPNCIYLNPPNMNVNIFNGVFHLTEPAAASSTRPSIDHFFRSLAEDQGENASCVILSGTGSDGTLGLKAIKGAGGMAMAQDETQARYNNMPKSAIDTGLVDYVLPVEEMYTELFQYLQHPNSTKQHSPLVGKEDFEAGLNEIFIQIRKVTGHDFTHYKRNTIRRRIERRMAVHQSNSINNYVRYLQKNEAETESLFKDLLITVTNFFRDPEAFNVIAQKVIPMLLKNRCPDLPIRIWIPGCATGEEAYSLAILLAEAMEKNNAHYPVQLFATDIDQNAVGFAREGIYPEAICGDVSNDRLRKHFVRQDNTYKIKKSIREMIVFAVQNFIKDAPFSKLDLVSCRNVLIYMDSMLQNKILPLFHYTLKPGGFLFLGTSESLGDHSCDFVPINSKWKIYRHKTTGPEETVKYPHLPFYETRVDTVEMDKKNPVKEAQIRPIAEKVILRDYGSPCVFINEKHEIIYYHGKTDPFLVQPSGEPSVDVFKLIRPELRPKLNTLLRKALTLKEPLAAEKVSIPHDDTFITLKLTVKPITEPTAKDGLAMVIFERETLKEPTAEPGAKKTRSVNHTDPRVSSLEQELASTKEYLQTTIEELETSNEELRSTNEELQSTNEELQSTNEELQTSREELQSTNEELQTVNAELQSKIDQLFDANSDLNNLLSSTEIATVFLDNDLCVKRFTPSTEHIFSLINSDIGRPIGHIVHQLNYDDLLKDVKHVLRKLGAIERELQDRNGNWFLMRILPYRTLDNTIDGVVITFLNISMQKKVMIEAEQAQTVAEGILSTVREPLLVLDDKIKVVSANQSFYTMFKISEEETIGKSLYMLGNRQWNIPQLKELLEDILPKSTEMSDFKITHVFKMIGERTFLLNARQIFQESVATRTILLAFEDITDKNGQAKK